MNLGVPREVLVGVVVSALAVAAMAFEHVFDGHPSPGAFVLSSGLSLALAALVFGYLVPTVKRSQDRAGRSAKQGLIVSLASAFALAFVWLGLPFPLAAGGVVLGLLGRSGAQRQRATAAIVIACIVLLLCGAYLVDVVVNARF